MYRCANRVREITTKRVRLSKEIASLTLTFCCGSVGHAIVSKPRPLFPRTSQDTSAIVIRIQLETVLVTKDHISKVSTILVGRARHHSNRTLRCTDMRSISITMVSERQQASQRSGHKFRFLSHKPKIMLDTWWIIDNDESGVCDNCSDNHSVFPFYCGPKLTNAILTLISSAVYPRLPALSNCCISLTQISSDCSFRLTSLFNPIKKPFQTDISDNSMTFVCNVEESFGEALLLLM